MEQRNSLTELLREAEERKTELTELLNERRSRHQFVTDAVERRRAQLRPDSSREREQSADLDCSSDFDP